MRQPERLISFARHCRAAYKPTIIERRTLSISLPPEMRSFIAEQVKTGSYSSSSEVVRAALRLLIGQDAKPQDRQPQVQTPARLDHA